MFTTAVNFRELKSELNRNLTTDSFHHAVLIFLRKPQVVNRKLSTAKNLLTARLKCEISRFVDILRNLHEIGSELQDVLKNKEVEWRDVKLDEELTHGEDYQSKELLISLDKIIPRNGKFSSSYQLTHFCK